MHKRIPAFDAIRVIAFGLILLAHAAQQLNHPLGGFVGTPGFYFVSLGGIGVTLFLLLSGIVLEYTYGQREYILTDFYKKRLARIYIPYWIVLIGIFAMTGRLANISMVDLLLDISAFAAFTGKPWTDFTLGTSWFLGMIVILYLLYPLLSKMVRTKPWLTLIAVLIISVASRFYVGTYWNVHRPLDWFPPCRLFEFTLGIWLLIQLQTSGWIKKLETSRPHSLLTYMSNISYPLFLVYMPLLFIYPHTHTWLSVCGVLLIALLLSDALMRVDKNLRRLI